MYARLLLLINCLLLPFLVSAQIDQTIQKQKRRRDLRTTIAWEPNLVTAKDGEATIASRTNRYKFK